MDAAGKRYVALELARELIDKGEEVPLKASGLSMGRTIRSGEWVIVRKAEPDQIRCGDIVIYQRRHVFVAHRVIRKLSHRGESHLLTKGDAHLAPDPPIATSEVIARVVGVGDRDHPRRLDRPAARLVAGLWSCMSLGVCWLHRFFRVLVPATGRVTS